MSVNSLIRKYRKERGLTQTELANKIGKSLRMVQKYESDGDNKTSVEPSLEVLKNIAEALDVTINDLIDPRVTLDGLDRLMPGIKQTIALDDLGSEKKYCAPIVKITEISDQLHIAPKLLLDDEYSNDFASYLTAYFYLKEIYPGISSDLGEFKELIYDWETNNELQESDPFAKNVHEIVTLKEKPHLIELNKLFEKHKDLDPKIKRDIEWLLEKNVRLYEEIINTLRESLRYLILE